MSVSRYQSWHRCPRHHHYRYELGYEPIRKALALLLGTLFHLAMEAWWLSWGECASEDAALAASLAALQQGTPRELDPFVRAQLEALVCGYHARWAGAMADIEVLAVERSFAGPLLHPDTGEESSVFRQVGKIDVLVRIRGKVFIVEHKTTSADVSPGENYWTRLRMDPQVSIYHDGAELLGYDDVAGCVYDVVRKPQLRSLKATPVRSRKYRKDGKLYKGQRERDETIEEYRERLTADISTQPESYYQRVEVVRLDCELDEARRDLWATAQLIRAGSQETAPRNPDACFRYGGACEYFDVCSGAASIDDHTRFVPTEK